MNINTMLEEIDSATLDTEIAILEAYVDAMEKCINICENVNDYTNFENIKFITESFIMEADAKPAGDGDTQPTEAKPADGDGSAQAAAPATGDGNNTTDADAAKTDTNKSDNDNQQKKPGIIRRLLDAIAGLFHKIAEKLRSGSKVSKPDLSHNKIDAELAHGLMAYAKGDTSEIDEKTMNRVTAYVKTLAKVGLAVTLGVGGTTLAFRAINSRNGNDTTDMPGRPGNNIYDQPLVYADENGEIQITCLFPDDNFATQTNMLVDALDSLNNAVLNAYQNAVDLFEADRTGDVNMYNRAAENLYSSGSGYLHTIESALNNTSATNRGLNTILTEIEQSQAMARTMPLQGWYEWYDNFVTGILQASSLAIDAISAVIPVLDPNNKNPDATAYDKLRRFLSMYEDEYARSHNGRSIYEGLAYMSDPNNRTSENGSKIMEKIRNLGTKLTQPRASATKSRIDKKLVDDGAYRQQLINTRNAVSSTATRLYNLERYYSAALSAAQRAYDSSVRTYGANNNGANNNGAGQPAPTPAPGAPAGNP